MPLKVLWAFFKFCFFIAVFLRSSKRLQGKQAIPQNLFLHMSYGTLQFPEEEASASRAAAAKSKERKTEEI